MNEDALNQSIRQFLKHVGIHSQREIEKAVAAAVAEKRVSGEGKFPATMTLSVPGLNLEVRFDGEIRLE
jgi:hypothetical protein